MNVLNFRLILPSGDRRSSDRTHPRTISHPLAKAQYVTHIQHVIW
ncbi:hypothetical protein [Nostoc sp. KVJ20]|nr:hypothetical protein [Nostoc sp. KVJ20]